MCGPKTKENERKKLFQKSNFVDNNLMVHACNIIAQRFAWASETEPGKQQLCDKEYILLLNSVAALKFLCN